MVREKLAIQDVIPCIHIECRLGQSSHLRYYAARGLCDLKSCVCGDSAVSVGSLPFNQHCLLTSVS
jgi:hypothetical protein